MSRNASRFLSGAPVDLDFTTVGRQATLTWSLGPGPEPDGWLLEIRSPGLGILDWVPAIPEAIDVELRIISGMLPAGSYDDIPVQFRVIPTLGGEPGPPSDPVDVIFPASPLEQSERFEMLAEDQSDVVASREDLNALGLDTFPDGQFGILPTSTPGIYDFYASQGDAFVDGIRTGAGYGHTRGPLDDPAREVLATRGQIVDLLDPSDYVGGGTVYRDPEGGPVVMLYHQETYLEIGFYSWLSAAVSHDGGLTFTDLGEVITPNIPLDSPLMANLGGAGSIGDASLVVWGDHLYAYVGDVMSTGEATNTVARIAVPDLLAAAAAGTKPVFHKYYDGSFSQPGIAGLSSSIVPTWGNSVLWSACRQEFIMTGITYLSHTRSQLGVMTSPDLVNWTAPESVYDLPLPDYRIYTTLVGDHVESNGNRVVTGSEIVVLTTCFDSSSDFWSNGEVRRLTLVDRLAASEGCVPAPIDGRTTTP